jgi:hypothetical protein
MPRRKVRPPASNGQSGRLMFILTTYRSSNEQSQCYDAALSGRTVFRCTCQCHRSTQMNLNLAAEAISV